MVLRNQVLLALVFATLSCMVANEYLRAQDPADDAGPIEAADPADATVQLSPEAIAAKEQFDTIQQEWAGLIRQIQELQTERSEAGDGPARPELDAKMLGLQNQASELIDRMVEAGIAAYRAAPKRLSSRQFDSAQYRPVLHDG